jgi:hypothetical protein
VVRSWPHPTWIDKKVLIHQSNVDDHVKILAVFCFVSPTDPVLCSSPLRPFQIRDHSPAGRGLVLLYILSSCAMHFVKESLTLIALAYHELDWRNRQQMERTVDALSVAATVQPVREAVCRVYGWFYQRTDRTLWMVESWQLSRPTHGWGQRRPWHTQQNHRWSPYISRELEAFRSVPATRTVFAIGEKIILGELSFVINP